MRKALAIGASSGGALGLWSAVTMFWPVPHMIGDIGRSTVFVAFVLVLVALAVSVARSEARFGRAALSVSATWVVSGVLTLAGYAVLTGLLAPRIVQLPEFARDYSYHGYTSPQQYLAAKHWDLLQLQLFSRAIGSLIALCAATLAGWLLRRVGRLGAA